MLLSALAAAFLTTCPPIHVSFDASTRPDPASGRIILYLIKDGSKVSSRTPSDGPFWEDPQPMYGLSVTDLAPGKLAIIDDRATAFPSPPSSLPAGTYRAQAVFDIHRDDSNWHREPGNLYSEVITFTVPDAKGDSVFDPVAIKLTKTIEPEKLPNTPGAGVELFEIHSKLLSDFHGRDIKLRAGVILPTHYDKARSYAAIYEVPGFGDNHAAAWSRFERLSRRSSDKTAELRDNAFWIVLDPESGNGHTLFADSANNGPCGRALIEELIPALEAKYKLAAKSEARLLRGHSSGGWSTLWLALTYPETFGATWSSSPDPVDFRRFQLIDIYDQDNMYTLPSIADGPLDKKFDRFTKDPSTITNDPRPSDLWGDIASTRSNGRATMSIRVENAGEEILGPDNTSGQQWDSWLAVWGPKNKNGNPAALYDPATGRLDHAIAEQFKKYDIAELLRKDPARYGPIFQQHIRLLVGDQDTFFLNEAVALLKPDVEKLPASESVEGRNGYIKILPGLDHRTIFQSKEMQAIPAEMVDHLQRHRLITPSK